MPITLSQTNEALTIDNATPTTFVGKTVGGVSVNALSVESTGMVNYLPYTSGGVSSANPTSISQTGGISIYSGSNSTTSTSIATPMNNVNTDVLPPGSYFLTGSVDISMNTPSTISSWGVFFDTSPSLSTAATLGNAYSASRSYVLNTTSSFDARRIQPHTSMAVNLTSPTTIYLNYYSRIASGFTANSTIVVARLG